jgi:hypothetical protein
LASSPYLAAPRRMNSTAADTEGSASDAAVDARACVGGVGWGRENPCVGCGVGVLKSGRA